MKKTEEGEDSGEEGGEDEWGDNTEGSLGNGSGASGASTTRDDESSIGGADRTSGEAEDDRG